MPIRAIVGYGVVLDIDLESVFVCPVKAPHDMMPTEVLPATVLCARVAWLRTL